MGLKLVERGIVVAAGAGISVGLLSCLSVAVTEATTDAGVHLADGGAPDGATTSRTDGRPLDAAGTEAGARPLRGEPENLAVGQSTPRDIVVDEDAVYWLNLASDGELATIVRLAKNEGAKPGVVATEILPAYAMAADATSLFWTGEDEWGDLGIFKHDKLGGTTNELVYGGIPLGCAVYGGSVYWADAINHGQLGTVGTDGTSPHALGQNLGNPKVLVVDSMSAYVGTIGQILVVPLNGDPVSMLTQVSGTVEGITADDTTVYWTDATGVRSIPKMGPTQSVDVAPGSAPTGIAVDSTNVYWTNSGDGTVQTVAKGGGKVTTLATGESEPSRIAADADAVYWTNHGDGRIRRIRR